MDLACPGCGNSFLIDEKNIDTDIVDCPKCAFRCSVVRESKLGRTGQLLRRGRRGLRLHSRWPNRY